MALKKRITNDSGVSADYWRITSFTVDARHNVALIEVSAYASKTAREAGKKPITDMTKTVRVRDTDSEDGRSLSMRFSKSLEASVIARSSKNMYEILYGCLKEFSDFEDAEDV